MAFEGSCHCGNVKFSVDAALPAKAIECNCSHCRAKGLLLAFFPPAQFTVKSGADRVKTYTFNTHKIQHQFCPDCGTQPFAYGTGQDGKPMRCVNLRCVPKADLEKIERQPYDGASA
jgi:hypothetical protein